MTTQLQLINIIIIIIIIIIRTIDLEEIKPEDGDRTSPWNVVYFISKDMIEIVKSSNGGYVSENLCDRRVRGCWSLVYVEIKERD